MGGLSVVGTVIIKEETGCRGAKNIYRSHDGGRWNTICQHNEPSGIIKGQAFTDDQGNICF
jgi:hypothetical protein